MRRRITTNRKKNKKKKKKKDDYRWKWIAREDELRKEMRVLPVVGMEEGEEMWGNRLKERNGDGEAGGMNKANIFLNECYI